jgi:hypothetical protein
MSDKHSSVFLGAVVILVVLGMLALGYLSHVERMKCMELGGNWDNRACVLKK